MENADQRLFLELTGFNRGTFTLLLHVLFPDPIIQHFGRPRHLDEKGQLGLYLLFVNSRMTYNNLCLIFGCTPARCSVIVTGMIKHVYLTLKGNLVARVHFPTTAREKRSLARYFSRLKSRLTSNN